MLKQGESVLLSCSATAVPEEGVRYEWESLSGDGLHLLSNANERSPLFTAPVSEAGGEYVYRLTAMSVGVYETATVTVMARGVSGGSVQDRSKSPVAQEDCDSFGALEGFREGCVCRRIRCRRPSSLSGVAPKGKAVQDFFSRKRPAYLIGLPDLFGAAGWVLRRLLAWSVLWRCFWRSWRRDRSSVMRGTHRGEEFLEYVVGACRQYDAGLSEQSEIDPGGCSEPVGSGS